MDVPNSSRPGPPSPPSCCTRDRFLGLLAGSTSLKTPTVTRHCPGVGDSDATANLNDMDEVQASLPTLFSRRLFRVVRGGYGGEDSFHTAVYPKFF